MTLPAVDEETFASLCTSVGDTTVVRSLVELFELEIARALDAIEGSFDSDEQAAAAHQLKGSAGLFGAMELHRLCHEYNTAIRESRFSDIDPIAARLQAACAAVMAWLRENGWSQ